MSTSVIDLRREVAIRTIPAGTRCHLWDILAQSISREYFVLQGDLQVLVREGFGPMYGLLLEMSGKGTAGSSIAPINAMRRLPLVGDFIAKDEPLSQSLAHLSQHYPEAQAIFMAMSNNGKIGLYFLEDGDEPDFEMLK